VFSFVVLMGCTAGGVHGPASIIASRRWTRQRQERSRSLVNCCCCCALWLSGCGDGIAAVNVCDVIPVTHAPENKSAVSTINRFNQLHFLAPVYIPYTSGMKRDWKRRRRWIHRVGCYYTAGIVAEGKLKRNKSFQSHVRHFLAWNRTVF